MQHKKLGLKWFSKVGAGSQLSVTVDRNAASTPQLFILQDRCGALIMKPEEIKILIKNELKDQPNLVNVYGLNLNECLIEPVKQEYKSSTDSNITFKLWTVLEESKDRTGYKITFDEDDKTFGLGILTDKEELMDIGTFGTFLEALKGM